jgi:hypothetical protein
VTLPEPGKFALHKGQFFFVFVCLSIHSKQN